MLFRSNKEQVKGLQKETEAWLSAEIDVTEKKVEQLRDVLRFHEHRYYVENDPLISDEEYDRMYKLLEKFEKVHPEHITPDSPTQRVGVGLIKDFPKMTHLVPMLSLENSYNSEDLQDWDRKAKELAGLDEIEFTVEPKFDGGSVSLIYENDMLVREIGRAHV